MQKSVQQKENLLESGAKRYQEWMDNLLSTPESLTHFEKVSQEFDVLLQLIEARLDAGLSQAELARKIGVPKAQIADLERCGYHDGHLELLQQYANAVGKKLQIPLV